MSCPCISEAYVRCRLVLHKMRTNPTVTHRPTASGGIQQSQPLILSSCAFEKMLPYRLTICFADRSTSFSNTRPSRHATRIKSREPANSLVNQTGNRLPSLWRSTAEYLQFSTSDRLELKTRTSPCTRPGRLSHHGRTKHLSSFCTI